MQKEKNEQGKSEKYWLHFLETSVNYLIIFRQLSDVTKDGALSLEEFCTAMHLVVLRRNNIKLPDILPDKLIPVSAKLIPVSTPTETFNKPPMEPPPLLPPEKQEPMSPKSNNKEVGIAFLKVWISL